MSYIDERVRTAGHAKGRNIPVFASSDAKACSSLFDIRSLSHCCTTSSQSNARPEWLRKEQQCGGVR